MGGNILCVMPWSGDFPFDTLGGVGMAVCFVYIIYKQYLFSFSMRVTTGAVYLIAVVVTFLPMIILEPNIDHVIYQTDSFTQTVYHSVCRSAVPLDGAGHDLCQKMAGAYPVPEEKAHCGEPCGISGYGGIDPE